MKLEDVLLFEKKEEQSKGTYAGVRFSEDTVNQIKTFMEENEIPQPIPDEKMHTTLLYSRKHLPDYKAHGDYKQMMVGEPTEFDLWESQPDEDGNKSNCLVLQYDCEPLLERHKSLMDEHGGTFDFDEFKPHVTLSYNVGDLDLSNLNPSNIGPINVISEYQEDLNMDWAKSNAVSESTGCDKHPTISASPCPLCSK